MSMIQRVQAQLVCRDGNKPRTLGKNRGAAGVDAQSIADVEEYGIERFLEELGAVLRTGKYRPSAARRAYIPKADGKKRPLGVRIYQ